MGKHSAAIFMAFALMRHRMDEAEEALVAYAGLKRAGRLESGPEPAEGL